MIFGRRTLTDAQWARIEPLVPGKSGDPGRTGEDNRRFVDAIRWPARTASPWRDLRAFIADDLGATPPIKQNPTRSGTKPIDRALCKERHLVECFFNKIKRFRRIALRCEETVSAFGAFLVLARAMVWIACMKTPPGARSPRSAAVAPQRGGRPNLHQCGAMAMPPKWDQPTEDSGGAIFPSVRDA